MGVLDKLNLNLQMTKVDYREELLKYQLSLLLYQIRLREIGRSMIVVLEGPDAAGKGGLIKRITEKLDPRFVRVYSIVKPTDEEYRHHYLARFWNKFPPYGEIAIFDRSWYGRVLVERVEKFATELEWKRAYREINEMERVLVDDGTILFKFYLHISKDEQLRRFKKRESDVYKRWKMNSEDWRNRRKWNQHITAFEDAYAKTHTSYAPWHLIEAEYKWFARIKALRIIVKHLESVVGKIKLPEGGS
jgi:polyphosphate kinase 2 (PPK2 family)